MAEAQDISTACRQDAKAGDCERHVRVIFGRARSAQLQLLRASLPPHISALAARCSFVLHSGGWLEEWDKPKKIQHLRPNKRHVFERKQADRIANIQKQLEDMPNKVIKMRKVRFTPLGGSSCVISTLPFL